MKLKQLEICGFKSFPDKTSIAFPGGISAIVGPNGCGKSNIVDAIQWVMGEQSVKQLRGKSMEDVIFAGANSRPAVNMAEVSLLLHNDNGSAPEQYGDMPEIEVTRRLYRSGESAYCINKRPCRLKDIQHLLMGSGLGTRTYAVIQQGNIGAITEAGPEERRIYIEEAAGITRYKARKKEALQKIEVTRANLLRVMDIVTEVERQLKGLQRQVKKAEQFQKYKERIRTLEVALAAEAHDQLTRQMAQTDTVLKELEGAEISHMASLRKLDAAMEEVRLERARMAERLAEEQARRFELRRRVDKAENDLQHGRRQAETLQVACERLAAERLEIERKQSKIAAERGSLEAEKESLFARKTETEALLAEEELASRQVRARLEQLQEYLEEQRSALMEVVAQETRYKNIYNHASSNKAQIAKRLEQLDKELLQARQKIVAVQKNLEGAQARFQSVKEASGSLEEQIRQVEASLEERRQDLRRQATAVQTLDLDRTKVKSRHAALKRMDDNYEWLKGGARAIMQWSRARSAETSKDADGHTGPHGKGIVGLVADVVEPLPSFENAVEAALGDALQYVIVQDLETALSAVEYLRQNRAGRGAFIPLTWISPTVDAAHPPEGSEASLWRNVTVKPGHENLIHGLLQDVLVAEDLDTAMRLRAEQATARAVVTKAGDSVLTRQALIGGSGDASSPGILAQRHQIREMEDRLAQLEAALEKGRSELQGLENEAKSLERHLQKLLESRREMGRSEIEAEKAVLRLTEEVRMAERHAQIVVLEQEKLVGEGNDVEREIDKYRTLLSEIASEVETSREALSATSEQMEQLSHDLESYQEKTVDLRLELTAVQARCENHAQTLRRLQDFERDAATQLEQVVDDWSRRKTEAQALEEKMAASEQEIVAVHGQLQDLEEGLEEMGSRIRTVDDRLKTDDARLSEIRNERESTQEKLRTLELEQTQRKMKQEAIEARIQERFHGPLAVLRAAPDIACLAEPGAEQSARDDLERLHQRISQLGDVHMGAISEYKSLQERHQFLTVQRDDLVQAIESLQKVIRKINRISQTRFMETFVIVNEKLQQVFPRLFQGGEASLVLTDPEDPLETGVEYMIHPPGKRLTRMSLLSGGEKALAAISFVFAIFLIKPASFCLMDEIDAPLDEANVFRFNELLKLIGEQSQIIMITHNKRTMEFADVLLGVTMENKGISKIVSVNLQN